MTFINNESPVVVDCDGTLLLWSNPLTPGPGKIELTYGGRKVFLTPHQYHIDLLKTYHSRGFLVIVWSANGSAHAKMVVERLQLEKFADIVMSKPAKYLDDKPADEWMKRVFTGDDLYATPNLEGTKPAADRKV